MRNQHRVRPRASVPGTKRRSNIGVHESFDELVGPATSSSSKVCSDPEGSCTWKLASRLRMAPMAWRATTRRVQNDLPLRMRSTS